MGIPSSSAIAGTPPAHDLATQVLAGTFVATGVSAILQVYGGFNLVLYGGVTPNTGWTGSVQLERSFDGGVTWIVCGQGGTTQAVFASGFDVSAVGNEVERGVLYRLHCTAYTSGTIYYRISTSGQAAQTWSPLT